jgi:anti-sigma B factor antagonist
VQTHLAAREQFDKVTTLALEGEICERELTEIHQQLFRLANRGTRSVVMDLTEVSHFDYRGVKPLIARAELFRESGGDIKLCGLSPYVHAIFRSAGAHDAFDFFAAPAEAKASFDRAVFVAG